MGWIVGGLVLGLIVLLGVFAAVMAFAKREAIKDCEAGGAQYRDPLAILGRRARKETPSRAFGGQVPRKLARKAAEFMANHAKVMKA